MTTRPVFAETHSLSKLFRGLTEQTFAVDLGVADPGLVDYLSNLLTRFVPSAEVWRMRDRQGRRLDGVAAMLAEIEAAPADERKRDGWRHVGDYTLFWTGVFPEALAALQNARRADALIDYRVHGKRSYEMASTFPSEEAPVLRRLAEEFDLCVVGLSRVRQEWERRDPQGPPPPLLVA